MINYWYRTGQSEAHKAWHVEIRPWGAMEQPTDLRLIRCS